MTRSVRLRVVRRAQRTEITDGRARKISGLSKPREEWSVLLRDNHPGYIRWQEYDDNQALLLENAHMKKNCARKSARGARALLTALMRCGRCGRMMRVFYGMGKGNAHRYQCRGDDPTGAIGSDPVDVGISCLGTTIRTADSEAAFRRVDHNYVLAVARAAKAGRTRQFILVSSVGAGGRGLYLRVKGEVEEAVRALGFERLDLSGPVCCWGNARNAARESGSRNSPRHC